MFLFSFFFLFYLVTSYLKTGKVDFLSLLLSLIRHIIKFAGDSESEDVKNICMHVSLVGDNI